MIFFKLLLKGNIFWRISFCLITVVKYHVGQIKHPSRPQSNSSAVSASTEGSIASCTSASRKRKVPTDWIRFDICLFWSRKNTWKAFCFARFYFYGFTLFCFVFSFVWQSCSVSIIFISSTELLTFFLEIAFPALRVYSE